MAGISRNFIVSRLLVWSWKLLLNDMVLKINNKMLSTDRLAMICVSALKSAKKTEGWAPSLSK